MAESSEKKALTDPDPIDKLGEYIRETSKGLSYGKLTIINITCEVHDGDVKQIDYETVEKVKRFR